MQVTTQKKHWPKTGGLSQFISGGPKGPAKKLKAADIEDLIRDLWLRQEAEQRLERRLHSRPTTIGDLIG